MIKLLLEYRPLFHTVDQVCVFDFGLRVSFGFGSMKFLLLGYGLTLNIIFWVRVLFFDLK